MLLSCPTVLSKKQARQIVSKDLDCSGIIKILNPMSSQPQQQTQQQQVQTQQKLLLWFLQLWLTLGLSLCLLGGQQLWLLSWLLPCLLVNLLLCREGYFLLPYNE
jgi:hypothetical protein